MNVVMKEFEFKEAIQKNKKKEVEATNTGYILEQAEQMCGGPERLQAALRRGAVTMSFQNGIHLYTFPTKRQSLVEGIEHSASSNGQVVVCF